MWGVGGIVVASAVWGAVLYGAGGTAPDLHGYRLGGNPCVGDTLQRLKDATGARGFVASEAAVNRGPALDRLSCFLSDSPAAGDGWVTGYSVGVSIELHKKTDPRAEFENTARSRNSTVPGGGGGSGAAVGMVVTGDLFDSGADVHPVTGVGDEAYVLVSRGSHQTLTVLYGGAVLSLQLSASHQWNGTGDPPADSGSAAEPADPDVTRLRPAMTAAMRDLMASLASDGPE
ncbi:hypothetical protein [Actinacidiphila bryophytorum]|uniref:hypothetical protein n=1 Tax=Actinacidiphila bryophytorum TaxID=1436133 RepID=UPI001960CB4C|nr:hypothetical protein [Actinacidiphila bryophytorum]MBM9435310.1 hypothetical protein [Actinacidiphila bryophytorum]